MNAPIKSVIIDEEAGQQTVPSTREARERAIFDALLQLPQAAHFNPSHIKRFIDEYSNDPRALWHVKRLSGIGGSEIGIMVANLRGEQDVFGATPADVIREKLLVHPPKKTTLAMRKGIVAETCIRQFFLEDYKGERDMVAHRLLESGDFKKPHEWMRYSPDDIVIIGGRRYLCDYKHPGKATLHDDIYLRYTSQLHLGKVLLEYNGIQIDGMLLIQYPENGNDLVVSEIGMDDSIVDDIIRGGQMVWDEVLAGNVPPFEFRDDLPHQLTADDIVRISDLSDMFVRCKTMGDALIKESKSIQGQISEIIKPRAIEAGSKMKFNALNVSVSEKFNQDVAAAAVGDDIANALVPVYSPEKMVEFLRKQGVDMSPFETGQTTYSQDKLRELMQARALSEKQFMSQDLRMTLSCTDTYKEAAQTAATRARDDFQVVVESKSSARKSRATH